jgi:O-acetyl-ADP-ribose deacetylase (regulator of RNase III)
MSLSSVTYVKGDAIQAVLDGDVDFVMHCANAQGVMGSGIAKQIKDVFHRHFAAYNKWCGYGSPNSRLGAAVIVDKVISIIGQGALGYGKRQVNYGALAKGFAAVAESLEVTSAGCGMRATRIAVPYLMGCDRAGGDWTVVSELLGMFPNNIEIIVYNLGV